MRRLVKTRPTLWLSTNIITEVSPSKTFRLVTSFSAGSDTVDILQSCAKSQSTKRSKHLLRHTIRILSNKFRTVKIATWVVTLCRAEWSYIRKFPKICGAFCTPTWQAAWKEKVILANFISVYLAISRLFTAFRLDCKIQWIRGVLKATALGHSSVALIWILAAQ
jgi:hypothetical protein